LSTIAFPSGVGAIPVEVTEAQAPLVFWHKELLPDSGGAGRWRGGLAQRIVVARRDGAGFECAAATFDRRDHPARGRDGGADGAPGRVMVRDADGDHPFEGKGTIRVPPGGRLLVDLPGGGGVGAPRLRAARDVQADCAAGYVTAEAARRLYGQGTDQQ
jgi:N-methylhydantoinase B